MVCLPLAGGSGNAEVQNGAYVVDPVTCYFRKMFDPVTCYFRKTAQQARETVLFIYLLVIHYSTYFYRTI